MASFQTQDLCLNFRKRFLMLLNNEIKQWKHENWSEHSIGNIINYNTDKGCLIINAFIIDSIFNLLTE